MKTPDGSQALTMITVLKILPTCLDERRHVKARLMLLEWDVSVASIFSPVPTRRCLKLVSVTLGDCHRVSVAVGGCW
jgi:hypothetical protein